MIHNVIKNGVVKKEKFLLGSGLVDKYGREIFEGDTILLPGAYGGKFEAKVFHGDGLFYGGDVFYGKAFLGGLEYRLTDYEPQEIEIIETAR